MRENCSCQSSSLRPDDWRNSRRQKAGPPLVNKLFYYLYFDQSTAAELDALAMWRGDVIAKRIRCISCREGDDWGARWGWRRTSVIRYSGGAQLVASSLQSINGWNLSEMPMPSRWRLYLIVLPASRTQHVIYPQIYHNRNLQLEVCLLKSEQCSERITWKLLTCILITCQWISTINNSFYTRAKPSSRLPVSSIQSAERDSHEDRMPGQGQSSMTVRRSNKKTASSVPSARVKNEHKDCDLKGRERYSPCKGQYVMLTWIVKTVGWQVWETWRITVVVIKVDVRIVSHERRSSPKLRR